MPALSRAAILTALMLSIVAMATARPASQQAKELKEPTATVAGRVTIGGKPAPGVMVMLLPYANYANNQAVARGNTDEDGRFRLSRVPAGRYAVRSFAPAFVSDGDEPIAQPEKLIVISDGETIEGINLALKRGGVITGRVTDASGRPMIEEQVILYFMNEQEQKRPYYPANNFSMRTDDRGVYRLYGLPAQRYLVSVGSQSEYGGSRMGNGGRSYPLTFHPGVTDESKATIVDLPQGGEVTGVDIIMGRADRSYKATGRIVDADTGKPLADISYGYGALDPKRKMLRFSSMGFRSDQKGEFRLEDLLPGHYAVFATPGEGNEYYSEQAVFEVVDQDISGVEMKLRRGCAVSGSVVVEGASLQDVYSKLQRATIYFSIARPEVSYASSGRVKFGPDGSFRIQGLSPGKAVFRLSNWEQNTGFSLLRVERDGIQQRDGIELSAGAQISGLKIFIGYSTATIRGQIKIEGMDYPEDAHIQVQVRRAGETRPEDLYAQIDARGRFVLEGVAPGDYEITASGSFGRSPNSQTPLKRAIQVVTVANGAEAEVTLVLKKEN